MNRRPLRQYLYFCTSNARKMRTTNTVIRNIPKRGRRHQKATCHAAPQVSHYLYLCTSKAIYIHIYVYIIIRPDTNKVNTIRRQPQQPLRIRRIQRIFVPVGNAGAYCSPRVVLQHALQAWPTHSQRPVCHGAHNCVGEHRREIARPEWLRCQYLYFCACKASKLSTRISQHARL
jgi:hypothetical protein